MNIVLVFFIVLLESERCTTSCITTLSVLAEILKSESERCTTRKYLCTSHQNYSLRSNGFHLVTSGGHVHVACASATSPSVQDRMAYMQAREYAKLWYHSRRCRWLEIYCMQQCMCVGLCISGWISNQRKILTCPWAVHVTCCCARSLYIWVGVTVLL